MTLDRGTHLGAYEIIEPIGSGGVGEVYRAHDSRLERDVAIKVLPQDHLDSAQARGRFQRDAKAVAALSHPNILAIHDFGEQEDGAYAVTELLKGETLYEGLRIGPIPLRRTLDLGAQIADGLGRLRWMPVLRDFPRREARDSGEIQPLPQRQAGRGNRGVQIVLGRRLAPRRPSIPTALPHGEISDSVEPLLPSMEQRTTSRPFRGSARETLWPLPWSSPCPP